MTDKIDMIYDEVKYLRSQQDEIKKDVSTIRTDVGKLKVKSGIWGAVAGAMPAGAAAIWIWIRSKGVS